MYCYNHNGDQLDSTNLESNGFLQINNCGIRQICDSEMLSFRRIGRKDYHIVYLSCGSLDVEYLGQTYSLTPGCFAIYPPYVPQRYRDFPGTRRFWIHFNGNAVEEILKECKLTGGVYTAPPSPYLENIWIHMIAEYNARSEISEEKGLLADLLYQLGKAVHQTQDNSSRLDISASYIVEHYNSDVSVSQLADMCQLSQSRFMHLFKKHFGMPPKEYQKSLRLSSAKSMLTDTRLSIDEISAQVGYSDALYFSRLFKSAEGVSPSQFGKLQRDRIHQKTPEDDSSDV